MEPLNLNVTQLAVKLFITRPNLSSIIHGKAGISPLMALKLSKAFNTSPQYWMNLQTNYDLWQASAEKDIIAKVQVLI